MFFSPKSFLGIDLGAGGVKLVELKTEKKRPVLFTYGYTVDKNNVHQLAPKEAAFDEVLAKKSGTAPTEDKNKPDPLSDANAADYATKIKAVCKAARVVSKSVTVSLPVSSIFHAVVTLPLVKKEELNRMLKGEIKKFVPLPLEEVAIEFNVIGENKTAKTQRVLINAVPHKLIAFYSKIFKQAGLELKNLEPESAALTRSLIWRDQAVSMLIDIGAERTNFFIIDNAQPVTHQSIDSGGWKADRILQNITGTDPADVEQVKKDLCDFLGSARPELPPEKLMDLFLPVIEPIIKEIEVSFELYLRQMGNENKHPEKIILTGGMAVLPYLAKYISDKFKIKCYVGDPWARVVYQDSLKPLLMPLGPRMSVAVGLALANVIQ